MSSKSQMDLDHELKNPFFLLFKIPFPIIFNVFDDLKGIEGGGQNIFFLTVLFWSFFCQEGINVPLSSLGRWFIPFGMNQLPGKSRTGQRPTRRPGPHEGPPKREREVRPTDEGPAYGVCIHMSTVEGSPMRKI